MAIGLVYGINYEFIWRDNFKKEIFATVAGDGIAFFYFPRNSSPVSGQSTGSTAFQTARS
jgi:hypothetical protein